MRTASKHEVDCSASFLVAIATCLLLATIPAAAQMQIPNPLIRPHSLSNPARPDAAAEAASRAAASPSPSSNAPVPFPAAGGAVVEDAYTRNYNELKERFARFYVSAIVGKQAILRRVKGDSGSSASTTTASATGGVAAPIPLAGSGSSSGYTRNESILLNDGDLLDMAGNSGALVAKVTGRQVIVYLIQETEILPGGKLIGKKGAVFVGEVENPGGAGMAAIVLERVDPSYKKMITVETKVRSASAQPDSTSGLGTSPTPQLGATSSPAATQ